jgi:phage head maturation protease
MSKTIVTGIIHKKFDELDDSNFYGGNLKPSEFVMAMEKMKGLPLYVEHDPTKKVGKCINAYVSEVNGDLMGNFELDDNTIADKIRVGDLRSLSFGAQVNTKTDNPTGIAWTSDFKFTEISLCKTPAVPKSNINQVAYFDPQNTKSQLIEVYNSKLKNNNNMSSEFDVSRQNPGNLMDIKHTPQAGSNLDVALKQQTQDEQKPVSKPIVMSGLYDAVENSSKMQRFNDVEMQLKEREEALNKRAKEFEETINKREQEINLKIKQDEDRIKQLQEETNNRELRLKNAPQVAKYRDIFAKTADSEMQKLGPELVKEYEASRDKILDAIALGKATPEMQMTVATLHASLKTQETMLQARNNDMERNNQERMQLIKETERKTREALEKQQKDQEERENKIKLAASHIANPKVQISILDALNNTFAAPVHVPTVPTPSADMMDYGGTLVSKVNTLSISDITSNVEGITASRLQSKGHIANTIYPETAHFAEAYPEIFCQMLRGECSNTDYYTKGEIEYSKNRMFNSKKL